MSEKTYTEQEVVLRERAAYVRGRHESLTARPMVQSEAREYEKEAASRYPLPKVTRARVVKRADDGCELRMEGDVLQFRLCHSDEWRNYTSICWTPANRVAIADLLANPTEEVEA